MIHRKEKIGETKMEKLQFKNMNQLKKNLKTGDIVKVKNFMNMKQREKTSHVLKVATNNIIIETVLDKDDIDYMKKYHSKYIVCHNNKTYIQSYIDFQQAKNMRFLENGTVQFLTYEKDSMVLPSLEFEIGEVWLELEFFMSDSWEVV